MTEIGTVIKLNKNSAVVRIERKSMCNSCKMCGIASDAPHIDIRLKNDVSAKANDKVEISIADGIVIKSSLIVYLIPLFFAFIGLLIGLFFADEIIQLILFFGFLVLGFCCVILLNFFIKKNPKYQQKIVKVLTKDEAEGTGDKV
ncbi:MAG: SoxR reducing system RseC family protein [Firmicutes bacterium]|nr:SoxR reducing system RseC family protein [Bacillota bacterium]